MSLTKEQKSEMIDQEEKEFQRVQKMIDKKDAKELGKWLKDWHKEELREDKRLNKMRKDDFL